MLIETYQSIHCHSPGPYTIFYANCRLKPFHKSWYFIPNVIAGYSLNLLPKISICFCILHDQLMKHAAKLVVHCKTLREFVYSDVGHCQEKLQGDVQRFNKLYLFVLYYRCKLGT